MEAKLSNQPLVSVIVLNGGDNQRLARTVESVCLQTYRTVEILMAGPDKEFSALGLAEKHGNKDISIRKVPIGSEPGLSNISAQKNALVLLTSGELVCIMDCGDTMHKSFLGTAVEVLTKKKTTGIVYCWTSGHADRVRMNVSQHFYLHQLVLRDYIMDGAVFRKEDFSRSGGFDERLQNGWEYYDLWLSIVEIGREPFCIPEVMFYEKQQQFSVTREEAIRNYSFLFNKHLSFYKKNISYLFEELLELMESDSKKRIVLRPLVVSRMLDSYPRLKRVVLLLLSFVIKLRERK